MLEMKGGVIDIHTGLPYTQRGYSERGLRSMEQKRRYLFSPQDALVVQAAFKNINQKAYEF